MLHTSRNSSNQHYKSNNKYNISLEKITNFNSSDKINRLKREMKVVHLNEGYKVKRMGWSQGVVGQLKGNAIKNLIDDYFKEEAFVQSKMPSFRNKIMGKRIIKDRRISSHQANSQIDLKLSKSISVSINQTKDNPEFHKTGNTLRWSLSSLENHLPPIHEQTEGPEEHALYDQLAALNLTTTSSFTRKTSRLSEYIDQQPEIQEKKILSFENEIFFIFIITENGRPVGRMIQYKEKGLQILERELKIKKYNIRHIWKESKYNNHSFMTTTRPPIKDLICKIVPDQINPQQLKAIPKPVYKRILANHCQELILMLREFCLELKKTEGKVINNKINLSNIFLIKDYKLSLAQWGYSSFREEFDIQQNKFETRRYGILRGEKDWFVTPEYLAPEIIKQLMDQQEIDIWEHKSSPDIWSLGISLFQILTLIPIWANHKVSILTKPSIVRAGLLSVPDRDISKILLKQQKLQSQISHCLHSELLPCQKNDNLIKLIIRMVQINPSQRITLDQIIQSL